MGNTCRMDKDVNGFCRHLLVVDSSATCGPVISPQNLGDLFARDRVVYLSPDAEEEMEDVEQDEVGDTGFSMKCMFCNA